MMDKLVIEITSDEILGSSIEASGDASKSTYNTANIHVKKNEGEYIHISYEWESSDKSMPSFVMDLMTMIKDKKSK